MYVQWLQLPLPLPTSRGLAWSEWTPPCSGRGATCPPSDTYIVCMCIIVYIYDHMLSRKNLPTMWGLKPRWARWDGRRGMERGTLDFKKEIRLLTFLFVIWMKMRANQKRSSPHEVLLPTARGVASLVKYKTIIFFLSSWLKVKQLYFAWAGSAIKYKTFTFMKIWPGGKKKRKYTQ